MAYLRCEACGAKALVAASRCPRCAHEFHLVDARGERVALARCRGCGIMHRRDRACHWCPPKSERSWRSPQVMQGMAAALLLAVGVGSTWRYGDELRGAMGRAMESVSRSTSPRIDRALIAAETKPTMTVAIAETSPVAPIVDSTSTDALVAPPVAHTGDSVQWTPGVARTWVNVRSDARRDGAVVGIIKPSERALLGTKRPSGWRQVKAEEFEGWVDGRLFEADSARVGSRG